MALQSRLIETITIDTGFGSKTVIAPFGIGDPSHADSMMIEVYLTKAGAPAGNTLDITIQDTTDNGVSWNDRCRFDLLVGSALVLATAPLTRRMAIAQIDYIAATDKWYIPSGSVDGAPLAVKQTVAGPFPGMMRFDGVRGSSHTNTWRAKLVQVESSEADFEGFIRVYGVSRYP